MLSSWQSIWFIYKHILLLYRYFPLWHIAHAYYKSNSLTILSLFMRSIRKDGQRPSKMLKIIYRDPSHVACHTLEGCTATDHYWLSEMDVYREQGDLIGEFSDFCSAFSLMFALMAHSYNSRVPRDYISRPILFKLFMMANTPNSCSSRQSLHRWRSSTLYLIHPCSSPHSLA